MSVLNSHTMEWWSDTLYLWSSRIVVPWWEHKVQDGSWHSLWVTKDNMLKTDTETECCSLRPLTSWWKVHQVSQVTGREAAGKCTEITTYGLLFGICISIPRMKSPGLFLEPVEIRIRPHPSQRKVVFRKNIAISESFSKCCKCTWYAG